MSTLALARKRIRARIQDPATPRQVRLAHGMVETGKGRWLPLLSSPLAQEILTHGYDPLALDRVYSDEVEDGSGMLARMADRVVLDLPLHRGLRERLEAIAGEIVAAVSLGLKHSDEFRLLAAPCGLAHEPLRAAQRLLAARPESFAALRLWGVDADAEGTLLPEAARRAGKLGLRATFVHEDVRRLREIDPIVARHGLFHGICCAGLTQRHSATDVARLLQVYSGVLAPGGTLLLDRFEGDGQDRAGDVLAEGLPRLQGRAAHEMLAAAGLTIQREHATGEGGCVVTVARKLSA